MRIAVTYDNGNVFQHFGHAEAFKIYETDQGKVVESEVITPDCGGHEAMAGYLAGLGVNAVICGGLGEGAMNALAHGGIQVVAGVEGNADEAVKKFLAGQLESTGVNCDHHENEDAGCGSGCGSGCGGCGGGCGSAEPTITVEGPNAGKLVKVHYRGTLNDGTQFDSSYDRGETLDFICGTGMMIPGFDKAVVDMEVGQKISVHLMPEEAYGMPDPKALFMIQLDMLPGAENLKAGESVVLQNAMGQPIPVKVAEVGEKTIIFDANHELAGQELNFDIELVEVSEE